MPEKSDSRVTCAVENMVRVLSDVEKRLLVYKFPIGLCWPCSPFAPSGPTFHVLLVFWSFMCHFRYGLNCATDVSDLEEDPLLDKKGEEPKMEMEAIQENM